MLLTAFFIVMGEGVPGAGALDAENFPDKASLSANRMRFDSKTGTPPRRGESGGGDDGPSSRRCWSWRW